MSTRWVNIYSDGLAAIRVMESLMARLKLIGECLTSLSIASEYLQIKLIWAPGHSYITENCRADEVITSDRVTCGPLLDRWAHSRLCKCWAKTPTCKVERSFWPAVDCRRSMELLQRAKRKLSILTGVLTGHCPLGTHAVRLNIFMDPYRRR